MNNRRKNAFLLAFSALCILIPVLVMAGRGVSRAVAEVEASMKIHRQSALSYYEEHYPQEPLEHRQ